jgi:poly-gamma-glutamate synthesis protein (capsule biosynthesis protein)
MCFYKFENLKDLVLSSNIIDYGEEGFKDTLKAFTEYDIKTSGAGLTKKDAEKWFYSTVKSQKIAIQSCGAYPVERSGFNGKTTATATDKRAGILWEGDDFVNLVKQESKNDSFIIVNVHGGQEYVTKPSAEQKKFYKKLCDSGAKVVFGSHPHVLQPVEMYNGSLIVWSLGNFVFNGMQEMPGAQESMIIRVGIINNKLVYYEKYDAELDGMIVKLKN